MSATAAPARGLAADAAPRAVLAHAEPAQRPDASLGALLRASDAEEAAAGQRNELFRRLNAVLPTRDTLRGLESIVYGTAFEGDAPRLTRAGNADLVRFAASLAAHPGLRLRVEGLIDAAEVRPGRDAATPGRLAAARALAVRDRLVVLGVPARSIVVVALGARRIAAVDTPGPATDRRVRLVVSGPVVDAEA